MANGSSIYKSIQDKIEEVEQQVSEASRRVTSGKEKIRGFSRQQAGLLTELATVYLPSLEANSVKNTIQEMRREVQALFDAQNSRRKELEEQMSDLTGRRKAFSGKLDRATSELEEIAARRDEAQQKIASELSENIEYKDIRTKASQAIESSNQNTRRLEAFEADSKTKLEAYEESKLFMYLVRRGFGTDNSKGNGLTKAMDGFVAEIVRYKQNKESYDFLKAMPEIMRAEVERQNKESRDLIAKASGFEKEAEAKYGLPVIMELGAVKGKTRQSFIEQIAELDKAYKTHQTERTEIDNTKGEYHKTAIQRLSTYLASEDLTELKRKARETPDTQDDNLVLKLEDMANNIDAEKRKITGFEREQASIESKLEGLKSIAQQFRSRDYESSRSVINSIDINDLLLGYMIGKYTSEHINSEIKENQNFKPQEPSYSSSSYSSSRRSSDDDSYSSGSSSSWGSSSSSDDSSSSGGGFGGGGFSSGGGFGGGGMSTGGGF